MREGGGGGGQWVTEVKLRALIYYPHSGRLHFHSKLLIVSFFPPFSCLLGFFFFFSI